MACMPPDEPLREGGVADSTKRLLGARKHYYPHSANLRRIFQKALCWHQTAASGFNQPRGGGMPQRTLMSSQPHHDADAGGS